MLRSLRLLAALAAVACAATVRAAPPKSKALPPPSEGPTASAPGWPAGPLRAANVEIPFALRRVGGQEHAQVAGLVRKLAARHLPGVRVFDLADAEAPPRPALGLADVPAEGVDARTLELFGRGLDAAERERLARPVRFTGLVLLAAGGRADAELKRMVALVAEAARTLGAVVEDPEARLFYSAAEFERAVARGGFEDALPLAGRHLAIHTYRQDDGTFRSVTIGLSKLALPDLVVNGHSARAGPTVQALVEVVAQTMIERGRLERPGALEVDLRGLRARALREAQLASLKEGARAKGTVGLAAGAREEGDAENRLLELTFDGRPGSAVERQEAFLSELFGSHDEVVPVRHDDALLAESARARARLLAHKPRVVSKELGLDHLMVKAPFKTSDGGNEWMWVEVTGWKGTRIRGLLANDPYFIPGLRAGATVEVEEGEVFDYLLRRADGTEEGNTTQALLRD